MLCELSFLIHNKKYYRLFHDEIEEFLDRWMFNRIPIAALAIHLPDSRMNRQH